MAGQVVPRAPHREVGPRFHELETALITYFGKVGQRKYGPAPRGALERDASKMLEQLQA